MNVVHDKGRKAARDRAVLVRSYEAMCKEFRVPRSQRISAFDMTLMSNAQLMQANRDLFCLQDHKTAARYTLKYSDSAQARRTMRPSPLAARLWYAARNRATAVGIKASAIVARVRLAFWRDKAPRA